MLSNAKAKGLLTEAREAVRGALSTILETTQRIGAATAEDLFEFAADFVTGIGFVGAALGEYWLYESLPKTLVGYIATILIGMTLLAWPTKRLLIRLQPIVTLAKSFYQESKSEVG